MVWVMLGNDGGMRGTDYGKGILESLPGASIPGGQPISNSGHLISAC